MEIDIEGQQTRERLFSKKLRVVQGPTAEEQEKGFCPLLLRSLFPGECLTFTIYLKTVNEGNKEIHYLPCGMPGEVFQPAWLSQLKQLGIERLYFKKVDLQKVIAYLNNYLLILEGQGGVTNQEKMQVFYDHLNLTIRQVMTSPRMGPYIRSTIKQVNWLLEELARGKLPLNFLWEIILHDYSLYNHSINVFLIALTLMIYLKKKEVECQNMGIAALFHDVGMTRIPPEILDKPETISAEERLIVQEHPQIGFNMLKEFSAIPLEALRLILEHHENCDGSGYARGLTLSHQHSHTRILRLVDAYEALTSHRPYRPAYRAFDAIKILREQTGPRGLIYDQRLLEIFIKFLAL
ncbi:MAG: HD domain-containing protein [Desulfobacca sp.]|nr:HD domain-containing protein [Desulfobacca sp.]